MSNEKVNESFHWKNKLDELDHLPGESVTYTMAAWEKLHDRLRKKPRNRKILWYWAAAACLLLILGMSWFKLNDKSYSLVQNTRQRIPGKVPAILPRAKEVGGLVAVVSQPAEKKHMAHIEFNNKRLHRSRTNTVLENEPVKTGLITNTIKEPSPELIASTIKHKDTVSMIVAAPVKRRLRVVHINELGKPLPEEKQFADNFYSPVLRAKLFNEDAFSNLSSARQSSDNILKIKISPSN